ncbi:MAG: hypothetical protein PHC64_09040 [Candidatus Gastranaerophilales bacterium]|nr:hypothetical protein [Candidatus Gastranaerophilales bacterium]
MKISSVNLNRTTLNSPKNTNFKGEEKVQTTSKDDDKYVKIPRWQYTLENWVGGIFFGITVLEIINYFINRKSDPLEETYRILK